MRLIIFDIDGTLTQSTEADEECFVRTLAEVCGFGDIDTDWSPFIGIGAGLRAARLSAEGAACVFPDFNDADLFLQRLHEITDGA
jgi:phosphoglycolate phosphatase-like HAD superfamily hydrolase